MWLVAACLATACPDSDECSTPADFTPPPDISPAGATSGSQDGIGSGSLADCAFDRQLAFDGAGEVLQLQSADGRVCVRLERRDDGPGSLANRSYTAIDLWVGPPSEVVRIESAADLCFYSSHHNFQDWVHAWSGTRRYDLLLAQDGHGGTRSYTLHVFEQGPVDAARCAPSADGSCRIGAPIELQAFQP